MSIWSWLKLTLALTGNLAFWFAVFNQIHATRWPRRARKLCEKLVYVCVTLLTIVLVANAQSWMFMSEPAHSLITVWRWVCWFVLVIIVFRWSWIRVTTRPPEELVTQRRHLIDFAKVLQRPVYCGLQARLLGLLPGNESLKLSVEHRILQIPSWPRELDGLVIAHLSDLHFTGKISREYFEKVVEQCNDCDPDLICLSGDIIDEAECLEWFPSTLGQLRAHFGKFYVLGNHDLRIKDENKLRRALGESGFAPAGQPWEPIEIRGARLFLAGNELPWYFGAETMTEPAPGSSLVISHSPDQIYWAWKLNVDLVLAGHCHGGQIRMPLIGALVAPSRYGVRFASGTFKIGDTLMHVSRGISGDDPIRWNCPPELAIIKINVA